MNLKKNQDPFLEDFFSKIILKVISFSQEVSFAGSEELSGVAERVYESLQEERNEKSS